MGHRNWINRKQFQYLETVITKTESARYVQQARCAEPGCHVILAWYNAGGDDNGSDQFGASLCECDDQAFCCTEHRDIYKCDVCQASEEEDNHKKHKSSDE